jgi:hypothetical protein
MPRFIIERQYLLPVYQHLAVEAPDLEAACREALDDGEHGWEDTQEDYEGARPTDANSIGTFCGTASPHVTTVSPRSRVQWWMPASAPPWAAHAAASE